VTFGESGGWVAFARVKHFAVVKPEMMALRFILFLLLRIYEQVLAVDVVLHHVFRFDLYFFQAVVPSARVELDDSFAVSGLFGAIAVL
jgi:hypothetical protein